MRVHCVRSRLKSGKPVDLDSCRNRAHLQSADEWVLVCRTEQSRGGVCVNDLMTIARIISSQSRSLTTSLSAVSVSVDTVVLDIVDTVLHTARVESSRYHHCKSAAVVTVAFTKIKLMTKHDGLVSNQTFTRSRVISPLVFGALCSQRQIHNGKSCAKIPRKFK